MTTPTQAQIEAVAKLLKDALPDILNFEGSIRLANRALTAAAEAGKPKYKTWTDADRRYRNATIERCAQVADRRSDSWRDFDPNARGACGEVLELEGRDIAAAIRAMKDK